MNSLEFINQEIEFLQDMISMDLALVEDEFDLQEIGKKQKRLKELQQIKKEIELVELIKIGCTGIKYNSNGGSVIKLGNINAMNFIKLYNRLEKICGWEEEDAEN